MSWLLWWHCFDLIPVPGCWRVCVQCLLGCLEFQFDTVISDRSMILRNMYLLSVAFKRQEILTWEMFLNRFDTLCLEAQLDLDNSSNVSNLQGKSHGGCCFLCNQRTKTVKTWMHNCVFSVACSIVLDLSNMICLFLIFETAFSILFSALSCCNAPLIGFINLYVTLHDGLLHSNLRH